MAGGLPVDATPRELCSRSIGPMTHDGTGHFGRPESGDTADDRRERRDVFYSGHVQGVGFRYTARSIASRLPVVGLVRNLSDGRVHLIVEGSREAIDELLARVDAEMGRYIRGKEVAVGAASGEFSSFDVAR